MTRTGAPARRRRAAPRPTGTPRDLDRSTPTAVSVAIALRLQGRNEASNPVGGTFDTTAIASTAKAARRFGTAPATAHRCRVWAQQHDRHDKRVGNFSHLSCRDDECT